MSLLALVTGRLRARSTAFAVIGAAALAVHGVSRSTRDLDLLVTDPRCLEAPYWSELGADVSIRRGTADDPLAGVVRASRGAEPPLDIVVGKDAWQAGTLARATATTIEGVPVPVVGRADLILLKLYAGGPQDAWDIAQLLDGPEGDAVAAEVEGRLGDLPVECRALWERIRRPV